MPDAPVVDAPEVRAAPPAPPIPPEISGPSADAPPVGVDSGPDNPYSLGVKPDPKLEAERDDALKGLKKAQDDEAAALARKGIGMGDARIDFLKYMQGSRMPDVPQLEPYRDPPDLRKEDAEKMREYVGPMLVFTALLAGVMKADAFDALNMMSAGMRGFHDGRVEYAKRMGEQWRDGMDKVSRQNQQRLDRYNAVINARNTTMQEKMTQIGILAAQYDDTVVQAQTRTGNYQKLLQILGTMNAQQNTMYGIQIRGWNAFQNNTWKAEANKQRTEDRQQRYDIWGEHLQYWQDKDAAKPDKIRQAYDKQMGALLKGIRDAMQRIYQNPYEQVNSEWAQKSIDALAINMANEMAYYNNTLRQNNVPVPAANEILEDPTAMRNMILNASGQRVSSSPGGAADPLRAPPVDTNKSPPPVAPGPPAGGSGLNEGQVIRDDDMGARPPSGGPP